MILLLINKLLTLLFFMASLNAVRHGYFFIQGWITSTEEVPVKYRVNPISLLVLGVSIGYMITVLFTGIKL